MKSGWIVECFGTWTVSDGLKKCELAKSSISTRRKNFRREEIKTAMVILDNRTISNPYDLRSVIDDNGEFLEASKLTEAAC